MIYLNEQAVYLFRWFGLEKKEKVINMFILFSTNWSNDMKQWQEYTEIKPNSDLIWNVTLMYLLFYLTLQFESTVEIHLLVGITNNSDRIMETKYETISN